MERACRNGATAPARAFHRRQAASSKAGTPSPRLALLAKAEELDPNYPEDSALHGRSPPHAWRPARAFQALDRALARDPYFMALLSKGAVLERMGKPRLAAQVYKNAIKIAPPPERLAPSLRTALEHAQAHVAADARALADHLRGQTAQLRDANQQRSGHDRFDESINILAGRATALRSRPGHALLPATAGHPIL